MMMDCSIHCGFRNISCNPQAHSQANSLWVELCPWSQETADLEDSLKSSLLYLIKGTSELLYLLCLT